MNKITIAIDGYSSTGKSTIAKQLAKTLGYVYVDTGAMYRAVTYFAIKNGLVTENWLDRQGIIDSLDAVTLTFKFNTNLGFAEIYLNGENVEKAIRTLEVSGFVSKIAALSEVRQKLVALQQNMGEGKGVVMDGRDIGTVVFPNAELKIFMTASAEKRATRRYKELLERGDNVTYEAVLHNITERDRIDSTRSDSPLTKAKDAIEIDNSTLSIQAQFNAIMALVKDRLSNCNKKSGH